MALALAPVATLGAGTHAAQAHPHVWIDADAGLSVVEGKLSALSITWTFDEFYSAYSVEDMDGDGDGKPDQPAMDAMIDQAMGDLEPWRYFTDLRLDGLKVAFGPPEAVSATFEGGRMAYAFTLPVADPIPLDRSEGITLRLYDPSFYIDVGLSDTTEGGTGPGAFWKTDAPAGCTLSEENPEGFRETTIADTLAIAEEVQPGEEGLGAAYAQTIRIHCS